MKRSVRSHDQPQCRIPATMAYLMDAASQHLQHRFGTLHDLQHNCTPAIAQIVHRRVPKHALYSLT